MKAPVVTKPPSVPIWLAPVRVTSPAAEPDRLAAVMAPNGPSESAPPMLSVTLAAERVSVSFRPCPSFRLNAPPRTVTLPRLAIWLAPFIVTPPAETARVVAVIAPVFCVFRSVVSVIFSFDVSVTV